MAARAGTARTRDGILSDSKAKRRKVSELLRTHGITGRALAELGKKISQQPDVVEHVTRRNIQNTITDVLNAVSTTIQLPLDGGGAPFEWTLAQVDKLLNHMCRESTSYRERFAEAVSSARGAPLKLVLYADEITPGDALALRHDRKFWIFFFSFIEFGVAHLHNEELWLPLGALRTKVVSNRVDGGISCVVRLLLREMFFGPSRLASSGAPVALANGTSVMVRARVGKLIADMDAHKGILCLRGANGWRPCLKCKNVVMKSASVDGDGGYFVDICCHEFARFDAHLDDDVWKLWDDLAAAKATAGLPGHLSKGDFEILDKASGFNYHPNGLLDDKELRAIVKPSAMSYDSMHNLWSNGIVGWEVFGFTKACKSKANINFPDFHKFTRRWQFPRGSIGTTTHNMFSPGHQTACKKSFKAGASELTSLIQIVVAFAEENVVGIESLEREVASLRACGLLASAFMDVKRGRVASRNDFVASAEVHLDLHKQAYGVRYVKPKHHYVLHNADQEPKELDCFVTERHNKMVKAVAEPVHNTARFEGTVLAGAVLQQERQLKQMGATGNALTGQAADSDELRSFVGDVDVSVSGSLRWDGQKYSVGDVVCSRGGEMFVLDACAAISGELHVVARGIEISARSQGRSTGRVIDEFLIIKMADACLEPTVWAWRVTRRGDYVVLHS